MIVLLFTSHDNWHLALFASSGSLFLGPETLKEQQQLEHPPSRIHGKQYAAISP